MADYNENEQMLPESVSEICDGFRAEHEAHRKAGGAESYEEFLQDKMANVLIALKALGHDPVQEADRALSTCEAEFPDEADAPAPR